jgi:hypothetical protein
LRAFSTSRIQIPPGPRGISIISRQSLSRQFEEPRNDKGMPEYLNDRNS